MIGIGMNIARKGMVVYLIGNPDQVKMKILVSFAPSWFISYFEPPASLKTQSTRRKTF